MKRLLIPLAFALCCGTIHAQTACDMSQECPAAASAGPVAFDAKMTAGNGNGGANQECAGATTCAQNITIGSGATALYAIVIHGGATTSPACTWNTSQSLTQLCTAGGNSDAQIWGVTSPATGTHSLSCSWTTGQDTYLSGISFSSTKTTGNGINAADTVTSGSGTANHLVVTSDSSGASVVAFKDLGGGPTTNFTTIFTDGPLNPDGAASYHVGVTSCSGNSCDHTFSETGPVCGIHVVNQ